MNLGKKDLTNRKLLHHGTMLLNLKATDAWNYLNPNKQKLKSKVFIFF
jgi:lipoate-protein ligase A